VPMKLSEYLDGMRAATTPEELQAAIMADFKHNFLGPTWSKICKVRIEAGKKIVDAHPHGRFVPKLGPGRKLNVCGETCSVGRGHNSTGVRYVWHSAGEWAQDVMRRNGMSKKAAHRIWSEWSDYPHRCLKTIEEALAGKIPDPVFFVLRPHGITTGGPLNYSVAQNDADDGDHRATRPCPCGKGTLFDWGGGWSEGFDFVNWHCDACPEVYTEYMTREAFYQMRQTRKYVAQEV
jgi:hypothetical protein